MIRIDTIIDCDQGISMLLGVFVLNVCKLSEGTDVVIMVI